ncbi:prepilin-type N-terminal cleavage/methylation domain-containing protein [Bdellovibrionota bacterium FG-1]
MISSLGRHTLFRGEESGFTLLEVIIALTIMVLAFASILSIESNSINATARAKEMNIVSMLARNQMVEFEYKVEGKAFDEITKEEQGAFEPPYQNFHWKRAVKEIKFPNLGMGGGKKAGAGSGGNTPDDAKDGSQDLVEKITKLVTGYFSKAIREISVTISWKRGSGEMNYTVATYWINLNQEFDVNE